MGCVLNFSGKGSLIHKLQELETRVIIMEHQQQMNKLLLGEKERLVEHLQKELSEVKAEKDKLQQLLEKQRVEQLQWSESKVVSMGASVPTMPVQKPESALQQQPLLESHPQPTQFENLKNIKCFRCGRKGHVAKSCFAVVNQVGVENTNKGQHLTLTQQVAADSKQVAADSNSKQVAADTDSKQLQVAADSKQAWIRVLSVSDCTNKSADLCQTDVIGSMYKVDITIHGVPTRALMDSGSQVCIVR